jgi:hypothetical protein
MREAFARRTDPWTSHAAADSITGLRRKQRLVLWVLLEMFPGGASLDQIVEGYNAAGTNAPTKFEPQSDSGIRTRVSELMTRGYVIDTGRTRTLPSGRQARILQGTLEPMVVGDDGQMRLA